MFAKVCLQVILVNELLSTGLAECARRVFADAAKSGLVGNKAAQTDAAMQLALSALVTNDLKERRTHDYM
jgi:hypothetical protein